MKVIVIGGSIAGLHTGIALLEQGFDVTIYERSQQDLPDRGAGLVIQDDMMEYLIGRQIAPRDVFGVAATRRQILDDHGRAALMYPNDTIFTSWNHLWRQLKAHFPSGAYHYGFELESLQQGEHGVNVRFRNGAIRSADLVIGADGYHSAVRQFVAPGVEPQYAGYVAYRGLIPERELGSFERNFFADKFSLYPYENSHILSYMVPGANGELADGQRLLNWVWFQNKTAEELDALLTDKNGYRREWSVPAGLLNGDSTVALQKDARRYLPAILADRVTQTKQPFLQVIFDLAVPRMYQGRVAILGDAAFVVRPHTASGTAKAYRDAITLAEHLRHYEEPTTALYSWNEQQVRAARSLVLYGKRLAAGSQLGGMQYASSAI